MSLRQRTGAVRLRYDSDALRQICDAISGRPMPAGGYTHVLPPRILDRRVRSVTIRSCDDGESVEVVAELLG